MTARATGSYFFVNTDRGMFGNRPGVDIRAVNWRTARRVVVGLGAVSCVVAVGAAARGLATADESAPTLTVAAPVSGSTINGTVTLSASAGDTGSVASVTFKVDGTTIGLPVTKAPYQTTWNTASVANGSHVLTATAMDSSGNSANVVVPVTVSNQATQPSPPPSGITVTKVFEGSDTDRQVHTFSFTQSVPAGDVLVLTHVSTVDATDGTGGIVTPNGVSDSAGDSWTQAAVSHPGSSYETVEVWTARVPNALPNGTTVTIRGYARGLSDELAIFAVSGLASTGIVDQHAAYAGYTKNPATPYVTTSSANELLVAVHGQSSASAPWWTPEATSPTWSTPVDRFDGGTIERGIAVDVRVVSAQGSFRSAGTTSATVTSNNLLVTLRGGS
jgi:Bacterial Ig domain